MTEVNVLFYDIETRPYKAWVWGCGEQYISHSQLDRYHNVPGIICLSYAFNNGPVKTLDWGYEDQDSAKIVMEFDEIIAKADIVIGKNSDRFDNKMLNSIRWLNNLPVTSDWVKKTDDLEKQMRKFMKLPSQSLDYISHILGLGGKTKMEFQDWIDIVEKNENGLKKFNKMIKYNKKDVRDTQKIWYYGVKHFSPKFNMNLKRCNCGQYSWKKAGFRHNESGSVQRYMCTHCHTRTTEEGGHE